ncbi:MAG: DUF1080 domain-containing protein [Anaerolineae bacterium]|nr:DUF1080 domain-containing protein [Anaerolineae bacterium]
MLTLVYEEYEEKGWEIRALPHGPEYAFEVNTLACVKEGRDRVATYTPGNIPGYRLIWNVRLVRWPNGEVLAEKTLMGYDPPSVYVGVPTSAVYGRPPEIDLMEWLSSFRLWRDIIVVVPAYRDMAFSPDGKTLVSISETGEMRFWQVADGTLLRSRFIDGLVEFKASFSPDLTMVACVDYHSVSLYRVSDGRFLSTFSAPLEGIEIRPYSLTFSPDGILLAVGWSDSKARIWRVSDSSLLLTLKHESEVHSLAFSPDGTILASGAKDGSIRLWRVSDGMLLRTLKGHKDRVNSLAFSPDGTLLASASEDGSLRIWRASDGSPLYELTGHLLEVQSVAFSPDGALLASGDSAGTVRLWSASDGSLLRILEGHQNSVVTLLFSPDGTLLASGSLDETVRFWNLDELDVSTKWTTVLSDSFDKNLNDWPISYEEEDEFWLSLTQQIRQGVYRWEGKAKRDVVTWSWPDIKDLSDFHLSVDVRQISGVDSAEAGVVFRLSDDNFYLFSIIPKQQEYGLWLSHAGEWETLVDWTTSSAILTDGWNRIEVRGRGSLFTAWVNGHKVAVVSDSRLPEGKVGLTIGFFNAGDEAVFEFDNFEVREPTLSIHVPKPTPMAKTPSVLIRLGPGKYGDPLWLEVVLGEYTLASGTTLLPGSAIGVFEEWLTFQPGLGIDVVDGAITLRGKTYPPGTKLIVNPQGELMPR